MEHLFDFLQELERLRVSYSIGYYTSPEFGHGFRSITVHVTASAAERWEVDFHDDGSVDVERFNSTAGVDGADLTALLDELRTDR
jgi:hypothetical protein